MKRNFHLFALSGACILSMSLPAFANDICYMATANIVADCGSEGGAFLGMIGPNSNVRAWSMWMPKMDFDMPAPATDPTSSPTDSEGGSVESREHEESELSSAAGELMIANAPVVTLDSNAPSSNGLRNFDFSGLGSDMLTIEGMADSGKWVADDLSVSSASQATQSDELLAVADISAVLAGFFYVSQERQRRSGRARARH